MPICFKCFGNYEINSFQSHFLNEHSQSNDYKGYKCLELDCHRSFTNVKGFKLHWNHEHESSTTTTANVLAKESCEEELNEPSCSSKTQSIIFINDTRNLIDSQEKEKHRIAKNFQEFALSKIVALNGYSMLSRKYMQDFAINSKEILFKSLDIIEAEFKTNPNSSVPKVLSLIASMRDSYKNIDTEDKRIAFLKEKKCYFPVNKIRIDDRQQGIKRTSSGLIKKGYTCTESHVYLFPLRDMLKKIFELPNFYDAVISYKSELKKETSLVSNFVQCKLWKRKIANSGEKIVFPLFVFSDDYESGNPLSRHSGQNKLAGTYVSIPCYPPEFQSQLSSIYHTFLYYAKDRG
ncbi:hypothetical protein TKK_0010834 [Trichogramma kaykai]